MCLLEQKHAQTALANAAADAFGQFAGKQSAMESAFRLVFLPLNGQLPFQGLAVNADAH